MSDEQNKVALTAEDMLKKIFAIVQRHISNLENTSAMMRNGHFLDAYNRVNGTKEGLIHIRNMIDEQLLQKTNIITDENNIQ